MRGYCCQAACRGLRPQAERFVQADAAPQRDLIREPGAVEHPSSPSNLKTDLTVLGLLAISALAAFVFRDSLGLLVFFGLALALLLQLFRVAFLRGSRETLKKLWSALRDALWGLD